MKPNDTVTLIVTRNYGRPHTWSLPTWKVYVGSVTALAVAGALMLLGLAFLVVYPHYQQTRRDLKDLERERDALKQQVLTTNQESYHAKERGTDAEETAEADTKQQDVVPASLGTEAYSPPVRVGGLNTRFTRKHLEFTFQLTSSDKGRSNRGGLLFVVFENQEESPAKFLITPAASINETGFPQFYKEGLIFPHVRDTVSIRRSVRMESPEAFYTHVTIYLFSPRGGLIAKERFQLDRSVFQQETGGEVRKPSKA